MVLCNRPSLAQKYAVQNTKFFEGVRKALRARTAKISSLAEGQPKKKPLVEGNVASQPQSKELVRGPPELVQHFRL